MNSQAMLVLGAWIAAGLTLAMFSFLYGDNPVFKVAEHLYIGVGVGYLIVLSVFRYLGPKLWEPVVEQAIIGHVVDGVREHNLWGMWRLFPFALGLLILTRLHPRWSWLSRWSFAAVMGMTAGLFIPGSINTHLMPQIADTVQPLVPPGGGFGFEQVNNVIVLIGVLCVLVHFFYSVEHRGPIKWSARLGVMYLMFAFGAMFGYTTMGRMSLLVGRMQDLIEFSKREYYFATPILLVLIVVVLAAWRMSGGGARPSDGEQ